MKYQVLADSGSTKTDWVLLHGDQELATVNTQGLNPYYTTQEEIIQVVQFEVLNVFAPFLDGNQVDVVHFYGAGCSVIQQVESVKQSLLVAFPVKEVNVYHDMLGAARAVCQQSEGLVCILGTGSNSCFYDGQKIAMSRPAPGFILGDEGGGTYLGKTLLRDYIYGNMSDDLKCYIERELSLSVPDIYENIYKRQLPNRYLASFAVFIKQELTADYASYFYPMVEQSFQSFFDCHVLRYDNAHATPLHAIGSIAYYFHDILERVASNNGCNLGKIIKTPMEGLIEYHSYSLAD
jgi:N-acetylglucosamine kinase-like BadF-type ATPase